MRHLQSFARRAATLSKIQSAAHSQQHEVPLTPVIPTYQMHRILDLTVRPELRLDIFVTQQSHLRR